MTATATATTQALVLTTPNNPLATQGRPISSLAEVTKLADLYAASGMFKGVRDAAQAAVKIIAGAELGLGPNASMTGIFFVKERITLSANAMAAVIQNSGRFRFRVIKHTDEGCAIRFDERNQATGEWEEEIGTSVFTMADAQKAGLTSNDTYRKFPRNMLYARAMSNGAKWYTPALFGGSAPYLPDELPGSGYSMTADGEYEPTASSAAAAAEDAEVIEADDEAAPDQAAAEIRELLAATGVAEDKILSRYKVASLDDLSEAAAAEVIRVLKARKAAS